MVTVSAKALRLIVARLEDAVVVILLAAVMGLSFSQIVARWFGGGWIWADELVRHLVLWLGMFGAVLATRAGKHIAIDAFVGNIPEPARPWLARVVDLVAAATASAFFWATLNYIEIVGDEISVTLGVTVATLTWPVAIAFALMGLRFLYRAIFGAFANDNSDSSPSRPAVLTRQAQEKPLP